MPALRVCLHPQWNSFIAPQRWEWLRKGKGEAQTVGRRVELTPRSREGTVGALGKISAWNSSVLSTSSHFKYIPCFLCLLTALIHPAPLRGPVPPPPWRPAVCLLSWTANGTKLVWASFPGSSAPTSRLHLSSLIVSSLASFCSSLLSSLEEIWIN